MNERIYSIYIYLYKWYIGNTIAMSDLPGRYLTFKPLFDRGEVGRSGTQRIPGSPAFRKSADKLSIYHINYVCNLVYSHILCKSWWSYSLNMSKYNTSHKHIIQYIFVYIYKPVWTHFGVQTFSQKSNVQVPLSSLKNWLFENGIPREWIVIILNIWRIVKSTN
jgi:hypothetical protein